MQVQGSSVLNKFEFWDQNYYRLTSLKSLGALVTLILLALLNLSHWTLQKFQLFMKACSYLCHCISDSFEYMSTCALVCGYMWIYSSTLSLHMNRDRLWYTYPGNTLLHKYHWSQLGYTWYKVQHMQRYHRLAHGVLLIILKPLFCLSKICFHRNRDSILQPSSEFLECL